MHATLALCLLAASVLAVANAAPSVGGSNLQDNELRELLKRLQTDLEAFEKKKSDESGPPAGGDASQHVGGEGSESGQQPAGGEGSGSGQQPAGGEGSGSGQQPAGGEGSGSGQPAATEVPAEEVPDGTDETNVAQPDTRAMVYLLDLNEKINALGNDLIRLWRSYGGANDGPSAPERRRRRRATGDVNRPQQVILRREILNLLTEMEYDLVALELLPDESPNDVVPSETPTELPTEPTPSESPNDDDAPQDDGENVAAEKRGQAPLPLRSPSVKAPAKESRTAGKPVDERKALMEQLRKFLAKRIE